MMAIVAQFACVVTATIAGAQRSPALFDSREGLSLRIAVDLGALMKERDSTKLKSHIGRLMYATAHGQSVLREYMVYQLANVFTPITLRTRLARATYVDTVCGDSLTRNAFFAENAKRTTSRNGAVVLDAKGAIWSDADPDVAALVSVFEYAAHIAALYSVPGLDPKFVQETRKYLDEFFKTIQGPSAVKREFADGCRRA